MDTSILHHSVPQIGSDLYWALLEAPSLRALAELVQMVPHEARLKHMDWLSAELKIVRDLRDLKAGLAILSQAQALMGPGWARARANAGNPEWSWILDEKASMPGSEHRRQKDRKYNGSAKGLARKKVYRTSLKSGGAR